MHAFRKRANVLVSFVVGISLSSTLGAKCLPSLEECARRSCSSRRSVGHSFELFYLSEKGCSSQA